MKYLKLSNLILTALVVAGGATAVTPAQAQVQAQHYPNLPPRPLYNDFVPYYAPVPVDPGTKFYLEALALSRKVALQSAFRVRLSNALDRSYINNLRYLAYPYDPDNPRPISAQELPVLSTFLY